MGRQAPNHSDGTLETLASALSHVLQAITELPSVTESELTVPISDALRVSLTLPLDLSRLPPNTLVRGWDACLTVSAVRPTRHPS